MLAMFTRWAGVGLLCAAAQLAAATGAAAPTPLRETLSLNEGWRFHLGDIKPDSFPGGQGVNLYGPDITHHGAKAGTAWGAAARGYDDKDWKRVSLPHDWVV